eukprot:TRINITY_DN1877_c0_g1::TRINITY_DN1877_c0_g1_i1::g.14080::m.14080 TRINITY_DN1877_c0_g1::TRINITY_DN1877_c0_g1_i1::g.14080  ORF type:complete len:540 (+),score=164.15,sp/Q80W98/SGTB_RAT/38.16/2e-35,TPR_11/PF13414.1/4.3e-20,TPR_11/PF13414.1/0.00016,TPR_1/PF00515.23/0.004,TPR_1/PF00515.23/1.5e-06,TPR_1/PF00515.23/0.00014,TPR_1/PF00515.23/3.5e+03,TPR_2/PF07719.12/4.8e+03,TPR_2/PF07719.12/0.0049,TPR_2/PF07719.12/2.7e-05,TPR_2/PF07719.12/0.012,TPR_2/PF07719.12/5.2e+02,TPR_17/PF13431.1/0.58,TPR_17/PF13431
MTRENADVTYVVLDYLRRTTASHTNMNTHELILQLAAALNVDLNNKALKEKYGSHDLPDVYAAGLKALGLNVTLGQETPKQAAPEKPAASEPAPPVDAGADDIVVKFRELVQSLEAKGYFKGTETGSEEYNSRLDKARQKFESKYGKLPANANVTAPSSASTAAPEEPEMSENEKKEKAEQLKAEGNRFLAAQEFEKAIESYTEAIALNHHNAIYFANRAAAHIQLTEYQDAIHDCEKAIEIDPSYVKAYTRLGNCYMYLNKIEKAIEVGYKPALDLDPNNAQIQKDLEEAMKKLEKQNAAHGHPSQAATTGGMPGMGGMPGGMGGMGDLASMASQFMSNPAFASMASNLMRDPNMMNMAAQMMGGRGGGMPGMGGMGGMGGIPGMGGLGGMGGMGGRGGAHQQPHRVTEMNDVDDDGDENDDMYEDAKPVGHHEQQHQAPHGHGAGAAGGANPLNSFLSPEQQNRLHGSPALHRLQTDPKLQRIFAECQQNPMALLQHMNDPDVSGVLQELMGSMFGGGGM